MRRLPKHKLKEAAIMTNNKNKKINETEPETINGGVTCIGSAVDFDFRLIPAMSDAGFSMTDTIDHVHSDEQFALTTG